MNPMILLAAAVILVITPPAWADEHSSEAKKGSVRVEDLPKPIPELLQQIQQLSRKIEPEISRLGSTLGQELKVAVKKLCEELQCQERPESKQR
jgi:gas vesicle protein